MHRTRFSLAPIVALAAAALCAPAIGRAQNSWPLFHPILSTQRQLPCGETMHDEGTHHDETLTMTFDARGHVLTRTGTASGANGVRTTTYHYDAQGRLTGEDFHDADQSFTVTFTFDANGRPITRDMTGPRGHILMRLIRDGQGQLTRIDYDTEANGTIDMTELYGYEHGRLATFEQRMGDRVQYAERYFYDAHGRIIRMERDLMNNGSIDLRRTYTYDARGRLAREENDRRADGTVDDSRVYRYECR